jgi:hypothetical protein
MTDPTYPAKVADAYRVPQPPAPYRNAICPVPTRGYCVPVAGDALACMILSRSRGAPSRPAHRVRRVSPGVLEVTIGRRRVVLAWRDGARAVLHAIAARRLEVTPWSC